MSLLSKPTVELISSAFGNNLISLPFSLKRKKKNDGLKLLTHNTNYIVKQVF